MSRDFMLALLLLGLAAAPVGAAADPAGLAVCSNDGVRWVDADGNPARPPGVPEMGGCAHLMCPGRERRPG